MSRQLEREQQRDGHKRLVQQHRRLEQQQLSWQQLVHDAQQLVEQRLGHVQRSKKRRKLNFKNLINLKENSPSLQLEFEQLSFEHHEHRRVQQHERVSEQLMSCDVKLLLGHG